jgi:excisionase family DNA binding protein
MGKDIEGERLCFSIKEVAQLLGMSLNGVYKATWEGQIPSVKIGKSRLVPKAKLLALLNGGELEPALGAG